MKRPKVLRIFNRYRQLGGEERAVRQIEEALRDSVEATAFEYGTDELLGGTLKRRILAPSNAIHNRGVERELRALQQKNNFAAWEIHNVFPAFSPSVYAAAFQVGVPVIQYLHNYRLSCVNGMFLNHGLPCQRCIGGNFWPAFQTACWHDNHLAGGILGLALSHLRRLRTFDRIPVWVAISEAQKQLHIRMGVPPDRIHVVPHFLDAPVEIQTDIPPTGYFLFLGRLSAEKGVLQLLEGWRQLRTQEATLVIAGDGPERQVLENFCRIHNLKNVVFRGFVKHPGKADLWRGARALIVPSIWEEPFGLVVLEAWAYGRAALVSNRGALAEIVADPSAQFSPDRPEEIAEIVGRHQISSTDLQRIASDGVTRLRRTYNRAVWLERIAAVYRTIGLQLACRQPLE